MVNDSHAAGSRPVDEPSSGESPANPYAPTTYVADPYQDESEPEAIRRRYLSHEASVQSVGTLLMLGAVLGILLAMTMLGRTFGELVAGGFGNPLELAGLILMPVVYLAIAVAQLFTGVELRRLKPWARIAGIVFSVFGLVLFPLGTLIAVYFLYLLLSKKGRFVCSDEYRAVIGQTPHIRYRTSIVVWILVGVLGLIILAGLLIPLWSRMVGP